MDDDINLAIARSLEEQNDRRRTSAHVPPRFDIRCSYVLYISKLSVVLP